MAKRVWQSKTVWTNAIAIALVMLAGGALGLDPRLEVSILGLINIGLRFATNQPITIR
jgi:hypothetical protein